MAAKTIDELKRAILACAVMSTEDYISTNSVRAKFPDWHPSDIVATLGELNKAGLLKRIGIDRDGSEQFVATEHAAEYRIEIGGTAPERAEGRFAMRRKVTSFDLTVGDCRISLQGDEDFVRELAAEAMRRLGITP
ncbi:MAG: hypothetical protein HY749_16115 [Gammaproteobacteria bacterium]|nr:hypothetical protein [Gammaproteobacteria bacterium]